MSDHDKLLLFSGIGSIICIYLFFKFYPRIQRRIDATRYDTSFANMLETARVADASAMRRMVDYSVNIMAQHRNIERQLAESRDRLRYYETNGARGVPPAGVAKREINPELFMVCDFLADRGLNNEADGIRKILYELHIPPKSALMAQAEAAQSLANELEIIRETRHMINQERYNRI